MARFSRYVICFSLMLLFIGHDSWAQDIDARTQCDSIMQGKTAVDRSYQPVYGPCCSDPAAMKSKETMEKCIGRRAAAEMLKRGPLQRQQ
jgi:hypothetical protein